MSFLKESRNYLLLQVMVIGVILTYICGMSIGIIFFINQLSPSQNHGDEVTIQLIIISNHPEYPFNFTDTSKIPINQSLIEHLNNTIGRENWDGVYYPIGGWFITKIFNATEGEGWYWQIYYRKFGDAGWNYMPVGVSTFKLNQNYEIKFVFDKT